MQVYYIFNVKKNISSLYRKNSVNLFKILDKIYYMHKDDINYGFNLFKQVTNRFDKLKIDNDLYLKLHNNCFYSKIGDEHIINDLYHNEIGVLKIKKSFIILETNKNNSYFLELLSYYDNYFVCDFIEKDFFFIKDIFEYSLNK